MTQGPIHSERMKKALALPDGARFYRCALQVNPFAYLGRQNKATTFQDEASYNAAIIATCRELGIEVIGVTDHYRVDGSASLVNAARDAGLFAFSGFEAVTKDGVHFLCLFNSDREPILERLIGACGVQDQDTASPTGTLDSLELLEKAKKWDAVCIAAHVAADGGGLLKKLSGKTRVNVWTSPDLLACALAGPVSDAPEAVRPILLNKNGEHRRERPVAVINAQDVNSPPRTICASRAQAARSRCPQFRSRHCGRPFLIPCRGCA